MKRLCVGLVLAGMLVAGGARADDVSINVQKLLWLCNGPPGSPGAAFCGGYVAGVSEIMTVNGEAVQQQPTAGKNIMTLCGSNKATFAELVQVFKNWAQAHPDDWTMPAVAGVARALNDKWSCP